MPKLSRVGDQNNAGGKLKRGAKSVFANGVAVALHISELTPHRPYGTSHPPHRNARTTEGSPTVFCEGEPVVREGSSNSCGHKISEGSPDVFVP